MTTQAPNPTVKLPDDVIEIPTDVIAMGVDPDGMVKTVPGNGADPSPDIEKLQKERDEERRRREQAEADAQARAQAAADAQAALAAERAKIAQLDSTLAKTEGYALAAHHRRIESDYNNLSNAIANTEAMAAAAERDYAAALEAGDHQRAARAQREVSKLEAERVALESGKVGAAHELQRAKEALEQAARAQPVHEAAPEPKKAEPAPQPPATPEEWVDKTLAPILGSDSAKWLKDNKQFITDPKLNRKFVRFADNYADDHGQYALRSPEFVAALNAQFFPKSQEDPAMSETDDTKTPGAADTQRARVTPAAPPSRAGNLFSSRNMTATQVKLPPKLASIVKGMGLDPVQYALQAVEDIKAGKLPPNFLDPEYPH